MHWPRVDASESACAPAHVRRTGPAEVLRGNGWGLMEGHQRGICYLLVTGFASTELRGPKRVKPTTRARTAPTQPALPPCVDDDLPFGAPLLCAASLPNVHPAQTAPSQQRGAFAPWRRPQPAAGSSAAQKAQKSHVAAHVPLGARPTFAGADADVG